MAQINDIHDVMVPVSGASTAHTYTEIHGGLAGCTITLNGVAVAVGAGSSVNVNVRTVSGGAGCFLLGVMRNVYDGSPYLGGSLG